MVGYQWLVHDAREDVEDEFCSAHSVLTFPARDLETLVDTGEQRFKKLAFELS